MKFTKFSFPILSITFFIGVGVVALWYLSCIEAENQNALSEAVSSVTPVKSTFENPCDFRQPSDRELEPEEIVLVAECFIAQNGYTDLPPISDKLKLTPENLYPGTDEEGLKIRHDSLERKAYSYYRSEIYGGSWVVMFRYKPHADVMKFYGNKINDIGRAVIMNFHGKDLRVQHSNYPLRMPEAKIINP